ncbi:MAG: dihydrofolate reductase [Halothiobacillaceae bacterium]|jgi:dihydrofolate reductase
MRVTIIAAMDRQRLIGKGDGLPWRLPADLRHFKAMTLGKPIIMGRKTFESIGRPLPGRTTIVITRDTDYRPEGVIVAHTINDALEAAREVAGDAGEAMVAGGANVYFQFLPRADRMILTLVHGNFEGDTWFPAYDRRDWGVIAEEHHPADDENSVPYSFITLQRRYPYERGTGTVSFGRW